MDTKIDRWSTNNYVRATWAIIALLVFGFGGWMYFSQLAGSVIASGTLKVKGNLQVIQHPTGGVVAKINGRNGDHVKAGEILVVLADDSLGPQFASVEGQWLELLARKNRLMAECCGLEKIVFDPILIERSTTSPKIADLMKAQQQLFATRANLQQQSDKQFASQQDQIEEQIVGLKAVHDANLRRIAIAEETLDGKRKLLTQGAASRSSVEELVGQLAAMQGDEGRTVADIAMNRGRILEIGVKRNSLVSERLEAALAELRDLENTEISLRGRLTELSRQIEKLDLRAPVDGVIYGSVVDTEQGVIRSAEPVMFIVPEGMPLLVRVHVMPENIDQVSIGQSAVVHFSAFSSRTTPELKGSVVELSADVIEDEAGRRYYTADVAIETSELEKLKKLGKTLLPGMTVEAFIGTDPRSAMSYLLQPFTEYFGHAFQA